MSMIKSLSSGRLYQIFILGVVNGMLVSFLFYWLRVRYIHNYLRQVEETFEKWDADAPIIFLPRPNIVSNILIFFVFFSISSLIVYRLFKKFRNNPIILWTIIGLVSITTWNVFLLAGSWLDHLITGHSVELDRFASFNEFYFGPSSFIVVLCFNLLYGATLRLISILSPRINSL